MCSSSTQRLPGARCHAARAVFEWGMLGTRTRKDAQLMSAVLTALVPRKLYRSRPWHTEPVNHCVNIYQLGEVCRAGDAWDPGRLCLEPALNLSAPRRFTLHTCSWHNPTATQLATQLAVAQD